MGNHSKYFVFADILKIMAVNPWLRTYAAIFVLTLVSIDLVYSQCPSNVACFAPPIDVAKIKSHNLTINSTCGIRGSEDFCVSTDCSLKCNNNNKQTWHPPELVVDNYESLTYWKSKNFDQPVFIQFDFGYKLILHQVTITFQFELPNGLYIQRSQDFGKTFFTLAYFAIKCNDTFGLPDSTFYNRLNVLCFLINPGEIQRQISYVPRRDEYVAQEVLKGGFIRDYFLATNIKIVLQEFFTPSDYDAKVADPRKFYFAIRDIDVQSSCYCNGMTNQCSDVEYGVCICQKNTEGTNCERCKPLFNNAPWEFGRACDSCECNQHADACMYNPIVNYGICLNCQHNTKGDKCDQCNTGFYRNATKVITEMSVCIPCGCNMDGVLFASTVCDSTTGRCYCKSNVQGALCQECKDGYYGLSATIMNGCSACGCSVYGTINASAVCDKTTGVCQCKSGFTSRTCSDCKPGFFGYPVSAPMECRECKCHPSGAVNMTCDKSGQCLCRVNYYGMRCEQIRTGYYSASVSQMQISSRFADNVVSQLKSFMSLGLNDSSGNSFHILGYSVGIEGSSSTSATYLTFTVETPAIANYELFLQYMTSYNFNGVQLQLQLKTLFQPYSCDGGASFVTTANVEILTASLISTNPSKKFGMLCLTKGTYQVNVWFPAGSAGSQSNQATVFLISLLLLPHYESSQRYLNANIETQLLIRQYYIAASSRQRWANIESQGAFYLSYIYGYFYSEAIVCNCNALGTINPQVCNIYGGQCNCKRNIYGRTCGACLPAHYNFTSGLGCVPCSCDINGSVDSSCDYETGQCNCKPNVVGRSCNQCAPQHYGLSTTSGCKPCACQPLYSLGSQCDTNGFCDCKKGVGSQKCDSCSPGYYDLTLSGCKPCQCNIIGTSGNKCNPTTGSCMCKTLVMGARCEKCTVGYYGFSADFPETCLKCHCTGKTQECDSANDYYLTNVSSIFSTSFDNSNLDGWQSVDSSLNVVGRAQWDWAPNYSMESGFAKITDVSNAAELYFQAPKQFLGDKRTAYMYNLFLDLTQQTTSQPMDSSNTGDIILKGKLQNYKLVYKLPTHPSFFQSFQNYKIQFFEKYWYKNDLTGASPTNVEMIATLSDVEYLLIRGKWTKQNGLFVGLANAIMQYSTYNVTNKNGLREVRNVEYCTCPHSYTGQFCQNCNNGYTRSPTNGGPYDDCIPCQCNGHSTNCHPSSGLCYDCLHNTEGNLCGKCSMGYYGIATIGLSTDCKECECPGGLRAKNQFANKCTLDTDLKPTCVGCETGYSGRNCEVCSDGYFGNPMDSLGTCQKCLCNSNIENTAAGNCNTTTGECLRCLYNTIGYSCEFCRPGFYGDALTQSCSECSCNLVGSFGNDCQNITGKCSCKPNVIGRICDTCAENTFNFQSGQGCELCQCDKQGSASQQCNVVTGKCTCRPRVIGDKCDRCAPGYYNLAKGCLPCECHPLYTVKNTTCDSLNGQCACINSSLGGKYSGRTCSDCAINAIGTPPNCELCHSPCYDNWQGYINTEASEIKTLQTNVTDLLSRFGGMSSEMIEMQLSWLNGNLSYVMEVFAGAKYNTSAKETQFKKIETHIVEFETVINRTRVQLTSSKQHFETTVKNFNGTVVLTTSIPQPIPIPVIRLRVKRQVTMVPKHVDADIVTMMAQGFITTTKENNVTGQAIYSKIQNQFNQIVAANASIADASIRLAKVMADLADSATERAKISGILDTQYKATYSLNAFELKKIHEVVANLMILQNRTLSILNGAKSTLQTAENIVGQAESEAKSRRAEAQEASQTVSEMKVDVMTLSASVKTKQQEAADLKQQAEDVLYDVQQETASLAKGVMDIAAAKNKTDEALKFAYEISNATMPVSLTHIQDLSNQIINTVINEGVINATYTDAQEGLSKAQDVQAKSQEALTVSQATLKDIKNLESTLSTSAALRTKSRQTQIQTDAKIQVIQNITSQIESNFNSISGKGAQTLNYLKMTMMETEANNMCFVDARKRVDNATSYAKDARKKAEEALSFHQSNSQLLPTYSTQINALYSQTSTTHANAQAATSQAEDLLSEVTEAERLLSELTTQKTELDALKAESDELETELNDLMLKYEAEKLKFQSCNKN